MLNSLQGLQQRLEYFSIADIANAEANAQTLILRLKQVQDNVAALAKVKTAAVTISQYLTETPAFDTDVVAFDSLENHPQLHAIIKASKLIKLHRLLTALKAGAENDHSTEEISAAHARNLIPNDEEILNHSNNGPNTVNPESSEHEPANLQAYENSALITPPTFGNDLPTAPTNVSSPVIENVTESPTPVASNLESGSTNTDASSEFPTAQAEFDVAIGSEKNAHFSSAEGLPEDFPATAAQSTVSVLTTPKIEVETLSKPVKSKQDAQVIGGKKSRARDKAPRHVEQSKALIPTNESFDLRLLDDLVSNYGEFVSSPNLPATIKKKEQQSFDSEANDTHEVQPEQPTPVEATAPIVKKNGDFDRQLKKIIKDYGEYDLYSDKQTTNIKKAGILAFVFLGLVFGGIYFFKAPPSTAKAGPAAASSSNTTADGQKMSPAQQETRGKVLAGSPNESKTKGKE